MIPAAASGPGGGQQPVHFWVEFRIPDGKVADFQRVLREVIALEEREDAATDSFQCFFSADGRICHIQERYADSQAVLRHFEFAKQMGGVITRLLEFGELARSEVHGDLSPAAAEAVARFRSSIFSPFGGFTR